LKDFPDSHVGERSHRLTLAIYAATLKFPREELYGQTSQIRRCAVSVGANIAEGSCRKGDTEFGRFLQIAVGSASELEYHLLLARDLRILAATDYERLSGGVVEVKKMLASLIRSCRADKSVLRADS